MVIGGLKATTTPTSINSNNSNSRGIRRHTRRDKKYRTTGSPHSSIHMDETEFDPRPCNNSMIHKNTQVEYRVLYTGQLRTRTELRITFKDRFVYLGRYRKSSTRPLYAWRREGGTLLIKQHYNWKELWNTATDLQFKHITKEQ